jgi:hypothetical protein
MFGCQRKVFLLLVSCAVSTTANADEKDIREWQHLRDDVARLEGENLDLRKKTEELSKQLAEQQKTTMEIFERFLAPDRLFQAAFADADPAIRRWAVRQLGEAGEITAIHFGRLLDAKRDEDESVRQAAEAAWETLQKTAPDALRREFERIQNLRNQAPAK